MNETERAIIILKNDALFVDGCLYDGFVLVGVKDVGGKVEIVKQVSGKFSTQSALRLLDGLRDTTIHLMSDIFKHVGGTK